MNRTFRIGLAVLCCLMLSACPSVTRRAPEPDLSLPPPPAADMTGATLYRVSGPDSQLHILVYRGGTLARLGHNHVMSSKTVTGRIWTHMQLEKSGFELALPVDELIVDDPQARTAAGADFPPEVPESAKEGTRKNMLREEVLDGARYPQVRLQSVRVRGIASSPTVTARVTVKDVSRDVEVATTVAVQADKLTVSGEFEILQSDFGIKPFSIGLGALEVQDRLRVKFNLVAMRATR